MLIFLILYVGCGIFFTIHGTEDPFGQMPRYVAIVIAICVAFIFFDRNTPLDTKISVYTKGAGRHGVMLLGLVVLLAGGQEKCHLAADYGECFGKHFDGFIRLNLATDPRYVKEAVQNIIAQAGRS